MDTYLRDSTRKPLGPKMWRIYWKQQKNKIISDKRDFISKLNTFCPKQKHKISKYWLMWNLFQSYIISKHSLVHVSYTNIKILSWYCYWYWNCVENPRTANFFYSFSFIYKLMLPDTNCIFIQIPKFLDFILTRSLDYICIYTQIET